MLNYKIKYDEENSFCDIGVYMECGLNVCVGPEYLDFD
ncbi:hypothetical protein BOVA604_4530 [Bacteroides ovatus]|nr:hypothetical protein BOVA604_4530 [Bacteroides ovatus]